MRGIMNREIEKLMNMLSKGVSPYMVVEESISQLKEAGFIELKLGDDWGIDLGGKYYVNHDGSTVFAFTVGRKFAYREGFRIVTAHTDSPCFRVKPKPDLTTKGYSQINIEVYGGPILNTWLDRPLSAAGRVMLRSDNAFEPAVKYLNVKKPVCTIPNLAVHLDRNINKGEELNKQTDLLPVIGVLKEELKADRFIEFIAKELEAEPEDILDYEIYLYNMEEPVLMGIDDELLSSPRLDNLTSVQSALTGIIEGERESGINLIALFDHEEIGSKTKQGAASNILSIVMEKLILSLGRDRAKFLTIVSESFMLSADVAHGLHPNKLNKYDITNLPVLGSGFCIKEACAQTYATDSQAVAVVEQLCKSSQIEYQKFVNRSDVAGGGTIGAIAAVHLPMKTADVGIPILAMHSARELMGIKDQIGFTELIINFFKSK